jgi:zinc protease
MLCGVVHGGPVAPPAEFPDQPPQAPPLQPATLPPAFSEKLDNGMEVLVISNDEIPWVAVRWYLLAGAKFDPPEKSGLAATTAALLRQGTAEHTGDELAELLDFHAISLSGYAGHEITAVSAGSLAKEVGRAVQYLAEVIRKPAFPNKEFKRHVAQQVNVMKVDEADGRYWADREFRKRVYGHHFLGRLSNGTSQSLPEVDREDVAKFHQTHYLPNGSMLIFSGAIEAQAAVELAKEHFGDWQPGQTPACDVAAIPERKETHIYLVDRPDATQSQIRVGQIGFRRTDPEYVPAQVFNQVFGGRLNSTVRVKAGLTYGARGGFQAGKEPGRLLASTFTQNETTTEALKAVLGVVQSMGTEPPTDEELSDAQSFLTGRFGLSLETPQQVAGKVFDLKFYDLPDNYYEGYLKQINQLASSDIISLAQQVVDMGKLAIVIVGNAAEVKAGLEEIAPVTVVQPDTDTSVD